jgi:hypothetical protein
MEIERMLEIDLRLGWLLESMLHSHMYALHAGTCVICKVAL